VSPYAYALAARFSTLDSNDVGANGRVAGGNDGHATDNDAVIGDDDFSVWQVRPQFTVLIRRR
jgi:hypothetical protein